MKKSAFEMAQRSLQIEQKAVADVESVLKLPAFEKAVDALSNCDKIITCASGSSGIATKKFAHSLCCIECNGYFLSPAEAIHGGLGCVKENDCMVLYSRGGKTTELLPVISVCNAKNATLIAVTENEDSILAKCAQIVLPMKIEQESDKYNIMSTSSFISTVALFDALLVAIMEEKNYSLEQFALIHPGGAVGELLNK